MISTTVTYGVVPGSPPFEGPLVLRSAITARLPAVKAGGSVTPSQKMSFLAGSSDKTSVLSNRKAPLGTDLSGGVHDFAFVTGNPIGLRIQYLALRSMPDPPPARSLKSCLVYNTGSQA